MALHGLFSLAVVCIPSVFIIGILFLRIVNEWERGVILTLGRYSRDAKPGLNLVIPVIQKLIKVDTRITTVDIPHQEVMTSDNVPVKVNAVVYMNVEDAKKAILQITNYTFAVAQYSQTALRDVIGEITLDELLSNRDAVADRIKEIVDSETSEWGINITAIKLQDVELPADMKRAMARQAEAERERRATIILSEGEVEAAQNLKKAADLLGTNKLSVHLRTLQTLTDISSDPSTKVIFTLPVEVLEFFKGLGNEKPKKKS